MVRKKKKTKSHSQVVRVPKGVSSSKRNFSIEEERLLYLALSRINLGDNVMDFSSEDSRTVSVQASDIMKMYGVDSKIGLIVSTIMGSTETTLYTIAVYTSVVGIKKTRFVLFAALMADLTGMIASVAIWRILSKSFS